MSLSISPFSYFPFHLFVPSSNPRFLTVLHIHGKHLERSARDLLTFDSGRTQDAGLAADTMRARVIVRERRRTPEGRRRLGQRDLSVCPGRMCAVLEEVDLSLSPFLLLLFGIIFSSPLSVFFFFFHFTSVLSDYTNRWGPTYLVSTGNTLALSSAGRRHRQTTEWGEKSDSSLRGRCGSPEPRAKAVQMKPAVYLETQ